MKKFQGRNHDPSRTKQSSFITACLQINRHQGKCSSLRLHYKNSLRILSLGVLSPDSLLLNLYIRDPESSTSCHTHFIPSGSQQLRPFCERRSGTVRYFIHTHVRCAPSYHRGLWTQRSREFIGEIALAEDSLKWFFPFSSYDEPIF